MLFPVAPKFARALQTLTTYYYITFGRKEIKHSAKNMFIYIWEHHIVSNHKSTNVEPA